MLNSVKRIWVSNRQIIFRIVFCVLVAISGNVFAENEEEKDRLTAVLDAFRATDQAKEQNLFCQGSCHLAKSSHRVTSVDIENSGARTLLDVLGNFPGLFITKDHFGRPSIGLYGLVGQQRLQIIIDGQRVNDPFDGTAMLNLPAAVIDFIDVYFGPNGTWFGEGSLLGVISVSTKQLPEYKQFGQFSLDNSLGGGFLAIHKQERIRGGAFASFSAQEQSAHSLNTELLRSDASYFSLRDISASGFFEFKISNAAQAFLLTRSTITREYFGPGPNFGFGQWRHEKFLWNSDIHLLKKRAQKNALDLFFSVGNFENKTSLAPAEDRKTLSSDQLDSQYQALRFELGTKFHTKPFHGHDLYFGLGGIVQGMHDADQSLLINAYDNAESTTKTLPITFSREPQLFGTPTKFFVANSGHVYGFVQDEWQIRAPLLFTVGSRLILPIESKKFAGEFLPNIAAVLIPINKLRLTIAFHTSLRAPTFAEESDRYADAITQGKKDGYSPAMLDNEKAYTIETSVWYNEVLGKTNFKTSFAVFISKVDDALSPTLKSAHHNQNEIHIAGLRSINEVAFHGGHAFALGAFYSLAFRKEFDELGYSNCQAGFIKGFSARRYCPYENALPRLMVWTNLNLDLASVGGLNLSSTFSGQAFDKDFVTEPKIKFETTYFSKPIWRYLTVFTSLRSSFFGYHYRILAKDTVPQIRSFAPSHLAIFGFNISL